MPTLTWIGKDKVVTHHKDVPYRVLTHKYGFNSANPEDKSETHSGNKIIHGDNLEALKSLLPEYEGRIDVVYIDPPYNTGKKTGFIMIMSTILRYRNGWEMWLVRMGKI